MHPCTEPSPLRRGASESRRMSEISRAHHWAASGSASNCRISGFGFNDTARGARVCLFGDLRSML
eukprot:13059729-Alexandrium_andersonii.AAC.1